MAQVQPARLLCTVAQAKEHIGVPAVSTIHDMRLTELVRYVSRQIEVFLNRALFVKTGVTQLFWGRTAQVFVPNYPITAVTSITSGEPVTIAAADYVVIPEQGRIIHRSGFPVAYNAAGNEDRWTLTYSGGLFLDDTEVTEEFRLAALMLTARAFDHPSPGIRQHTQGQDLNTEYFKQGEGFLMPPEVVELIGGYVNRSF